MFKQFSNAVLMHRERLIAAILCNSPSSTEPGIGSQTEFFTAHVQDEGTDPCSYKQKSTSRKLRMPYRPTLSPMPVPVISNALHWRFFVVVRVLQSNILELLTIRHPFFRSVSCVTYCLNFFFNYIDQHFECSNGSRLVLKTEVYHLLRSSTVHSRLASNDAALLALVKSILRPFTVAFAMFKALKTLKQ